MSFQLRTVGAGVGALAICLMLSLLTWQLVLAGFAAASVIWAFWSWSVQLAPPKHDMQKNAVAFQRGARNSRKNIYTFPGNEWGNQSSGY